MYEGGSLVDAIAALSCAFERPGSSTACRKQDDCVHLLLAGRECKSVKNIGSEVTCYAAPRDVRIFGRRALVSGATVDWAVLQRFDRPMNLEAVVLVSRPRDRSGHL